MINEGIVKANKEIAEQKWMEQYENVKKFYKENHHLHIPTKNSKYKKMVAWLTRQRVLYREQNWNILTKKHIQLLNELDKNWATPNNAEYKWKRNFDFCKDFYEKYDCLEIPLHYEPDGIKIGRWLRCQRERYFGKRQPTLEQWQIDALNSIHMDWENPKEKWKTYQTSFPEQALFFYVQKSFPDAQNSYTLGDYEYDIYIPSINTVIEYDGTFHHKDNKENTDEKRNAYCAEHNIHLIRVREKTLNTNLDGIKCFVREDNTITGLTKVIIKVMQYLGSNQDVDLHRDATKIVDMYMQYPESRWMRSYAIVKDYYDKNGTIVGMPQVINGLNVKSFLGKQRARYHLQEKTTPLSSKQIDLLNDIGFDFRRGLSFGKIGSGDDDQVEIIHRPITSFDEAFKYAKKFYEENGHLCVPLRYETSGFKLGDWIGWMRKKYNGVNDATPLEPEHIKKLESIGMIWDVLKYEWEQKYNLLKEYYNEFGTINIGRDVIYHSVKLGRWLHCQREIRKGTRNGILSEEQIKKLDTLKFNWMVIDDDLELSQKVLDAYNVVIIKNGGIKKTYINHFEYSWMKKYFSIREYYNKNGTINGATSVIKDFDAHSFLGKQRDDYKKQCLSKEQILLLKEIDFEFETGNSFGVLPDGCKQYRKTQVKSQHTS